MDELAEERRSILTPARLLVGSLIGGAGIVLLGLFFGAPSASAAEPAPSDPVAHTALSAAASLLPEVDDAVPGTLGQVGDAVVAAARPVAAVMPAPVRQAVSPVTAPVTTAVDDLLTSIPLTHDLLGADPVGTGVTPVAGTGIGSVMAPSGAPTVLAGPSGQRSAILGSSGAHPVTGWNRSAPPDPAAPGGTTPFDQPAISGSGVAVSGSAAAGPLAAVPTDSFALSTAARSVLGAFTDDRLPVSAVADHDTSPD